MNTMVQSEVLFGVGEVVDPATKGCRKARLTTKTADR